MSSYVTLTEKFVGSVVNFVDVNYGYAKDEGMVGFLKRQVLSRIGMLTSTILLAMPLLADSVIGIGAGVITIFTGGACASINKFAKNHFIVIRNVIALPVLLMLKILNPKAEAEVDKKGDGLIVRKVKEKASKIIHNCQCFDSENVFKRHIAFRVFLISLKLACVIARIVDGVIGIIAAVGSFLTLGTIKELNAYAFSGLQVPDVVCELFKFIVFMINPLADELE